MIVFKVLNIIGSMGLFLYGMNLMSEALQKIAGDRLKSTLSAVTSNRFRGLSAGLLFTGILQSSSATTVLIVSFVNAGIISLSESVALIMGANIGTTIKLWFLAALGFGSNFNITVILLPLVAVAIPMFFSSGSRKRSCAEFIMGFALLFFGLQFMKEQIPAMDPDSAFVQKIIHFKPGTEFVAMLTFIGIGALLTAIFQSSSAMITLTIVLAIERWIPFEMAAAMVLGENIGTTTTALFASIVANNSAKRAALIHLIFNVFGVIWAAALFKPITLGIHLITGTDPSPSAEMPKETIPYSLAILHTGFNLLNTLLLVGFTGQLVKLTYLVIPSRGKKKEKSQLRFIESHISSVSEISILQARKEVLQMSKIVQEMFGIIPLLLIEKDAVVYGKLLKRVEKLEGKIDRMEDETAHYLSKVAQGKLSRKGTEELQALLRCIDEIESIGDACYKMSSIIRSKNDMKLYFIQDLRDRLQILFGHVDESLELMNRHLGADLFKIRPEDAEAAEEKINRYRDDLREEHLKDVREEKYSHQSGIVYIELITQCEKIGDYAMNVTRSLVSAR